MSTCETGGVTLRLNYYLYINSNIRQQDNIHVTHVMLSCAIMQLPSSNNNLKPQLTDALYTHTVKSDREQIDR